MQVLHLQAKQRSCIGSTRNTYTCTYYDQKYQDQSSRAQVDKHRNNSRRWAAEQKKQDKRLTETGEQGTSCPSSFTPQKAYHPHMHGPSYTDRQQCIICHDTSGSAGSPMTVSGVDTAGMP